MEQLRQSDGGKERPSISTVPSFFACAATFAANAYPTTPLLSVPISCVHLCAKARWGCNRRELTGSVLCGLRGRRSGGSRYTHVSHCGQGIEHNCGDSDNSFLMAAIHLLWLWTNAPGRRWASKVAAFQTPTPHKQPPLYGIVGNNDNELALPCLPHEVDLKLYISWVLLWRLTYSRLFLHLHHNFHNCVSPSPIRT